MCCTVVLLGACHLLHTHFFSIFRPPSLPAAHNMHLNDTTPPRLLRTSSQESETSPFFSLSSFFIQI